MNKEQGSSVIALIAVAAVAILVGIWIGAKTDIAEMEMDSMPVVQKIMKKEVKAPEAVVETTDEAVKVTETE
jgi:hypothetical protein